MKREGPSQERARVAISEELPVVIQATNPHPMFSMWQLIQTLGQEPSVNKRALLTGGPRKPGSP